MLQSKPRELNGHAQCGYRDRSNKKYEHKQMCPETISEMQENVPGRMPGLVKHEKDGDNNHAGNGAHKNQTKGDRSGRSKQRK